MKKILFLCTALLSLVASAEAQSMVKISGHVVDSVMREDYPFVYIDVIHNDSIIAKTHTDFDGNFILQVPAKEYVLQFKAVGCYQKQIAIMADRNIYFDTVVMVAADPFFYNDPHIVRHPPVIDIDPNGASQQMEVEGIKVIAR